MSSGPPDPERERRWFVWQYDGSETELVKASRLAESEARVAELEDDLKNCKAALRAIKDTWCRFHPTAGYMFESDPRDMARAALEGE